jgi:hypothetical protein
VLHTFHTAQSPFAATRHKRPIKSANPSARKHATSNKPRHSLPVRQKLPIVEQSGITWNSTSRLVTVITSIGPRKNPRFRAKHLIVIKSDVVECRLLRPPAARIEMPVPAQRSSGACGLLISRRKGNRLRRTDVGSPSDYHRTVFDHEISPTHGIVIREIRPQDNTQDRSVGRVNGYLSMIARPRLERIAVPRNQDFHLVVRLTPRYLITKYGYLRGCALFPVAPRQLSAPRVAQRILQHRTKFP